MVKKVNWSKYYKNIPPSVQIGKCVYRILWVDQFHNDKEQLGETNLGEEKYIVINFNQSIKETVHTYWHEILHAISEEFDANLTENQVIAIEKSLHYLMRPGNLFKKEVKNGKSKTNKRKRRNIRRLR